jgi:V8-like Glu-specific endopeptidase
MTAVFMLLLLFPGMYLAAEDWSSIVRKAGSGIAKIELQDASGNTVGQGTGFVISTEENQELLITNAHVVRKAYFDSSVSLNIRFHYQNDDPRDFRGTIEAFDTGFDLAAIKLDEPAPQTISIGKKQAPHLMNEIIVIGYPLGRNFKVTPGFIQAVQDVEQMGPMIDISANLAPGNSGAPVINNRGRVIGIATSMIPGYNFNLAIPVNKLYVFLESEENMMSVRISTDIEDAWIFIDGEYKGKSPTTLTIINREHSLRIEKQAYELIEETIGPWEQQDPVPLSFKLVRKKKDFPEVTITTSPSGAEIFVNKEPVGSSPVTIKRPANRILRIRATLKGHKEASLRYTVTEASQQQTELELEEKGWIW